MLSDKDDRNKLLYGLVDSIIVYDDSIELVLYYSLDHRKQSFETIQLLKERAKEMREISEIESGLETVSVYEKNWDNTDICFMFDAIQQNFESVLQVMEEKEGSDHVTEWFEELFHNLDKLHKGIYTKEVQDYIDAHFF